MTKIKQLSILLLIVIFSVLSCEEAKPIATKSDEANMLNLDLELEGNTLSTITNGTSLTLENALPYGTAEISIKDIEISPLASVNRNVGDMLQVVQSPIDLTVTAEDGTTEKTYALTLETEGSPEAEILHIVFKADKSYSTSITDFKIVLTEELPFLTENLVVEELTLSIGATATVTVGDTIEFSASALSISVTASLPSISNTYSLEYSRDEGLEISPNYDLSAGSSYKLGPSDVYVDGSQLAENFTHDFIHGYADFNGDGHTDVLFATGIFQSYEYSPVYLYLGDGTGVNADFCECAGECTLFECNSFTEATDILPSGFQGLQHPRKILTGDYNNDGMIDAYLIGHGTDLEPFSGESPILLLNTGTGFTPTKFTDHTGFDHGGSSADIDNDGDIDIFTASSLGDPSFFLINDGSGNFNINTERLDDAIPGGYFTAELIDVDLDGYMDLIIGGHEFEGTVTYILWGNSYGKYFSGLSTVIPTLENFQVVADIDAEDIDGDGDIDVILNRPAGGGDEPFYESYAIQILLNEGGRVFIDRTSTLIPDNVETPWRIWTHMQDLDNDGDIDIYGETNHYSNIKWLNDGAGNFIKSN